MFSIPQNQLIDMMSIGTLLAYTIVGVCVIVLRYKENDQHHYCPQNISSSKRQIALQLVNANSVEQPSTLTSKVANLSLTAYCFHAIITCIILDFSVERFGSTILLGVIALMVILVVFIARQPQNTSQLTFKVPMVPFLPLLSILLNIYLMFQLDIHTWIRFGIWLAIGYVIFFTYGIRWSVEGNREKVELRQHGIEDKVIYQTNGHSNSAFITDNNSIEYIQK